MTQTGKRFACPKCGRDDSLWRGLDVPAWQSVDALLEPIGQIEVNEHDAESTGAYGCGECSWEGHTLDNVGLDGEPLPVIHPGQLVIE